MTDRERGRSGRPRILLTSAMTCLSPEEKPLASRASVWERMLKAICSRKTSLLGEAPESIAVLWLASSLIPDSSKAETGWMTKATALAGAGLGVGGGGG